MIEKIKNKTGTYCGQILPVCQDTIINKINELIDATNRYEDIIRQIGEWGSSKGECLWCEKLTEVNLDTETKLDRTRKALDVAVDALTRIAVSPETMMEPEKVVPQLADLALEQITAILENKRINNENNKVEYTGLS